MNNMRACKISSNPSKCINLAQINIKHIMIRTIRTCKILNTSELTERCAIANTGELFWGSSHLLYVPAFTAMKDFNYNQSRKITRVATPTMSFLKNSWTHKSLTCSHKNNSPQEPASLPRPQLPTPITMVGTLDDLFSWSPTNTLTSKDPRGWI